MRAQLHVITRPNDIDAKALIDRCGNPDDCRTDIVDLTVPEPNYELLLENLFTADSVAVW
jgi:hypothetical protein